MSRWRSAWAVDKLARGLRIALLTLLAMMGFLALVWRGYGLARPPTWSPWLAFVDLGIFGVPMLASAAVFVATIRKAKRHS